MTEASSFAERHLPGLLPALATVLSQGPPPSEISELAPSRHFTLLRSGRTRLVVAFAFACVWSATNGCMRFLTKLLGASLWHCKVRASCSLYSQQARRRCIRMLGTLQEPEDEREIFGDISDDEPEKEFQPKGRYHRA